MTDGRIIFARFAIWWIAEAAVGRRSRRNLAQSLSEDVPWGKAADLNCKTTACFRSSYL